MSIRKIIRKEAHHHTQFQTNDDEEIISHGQGSQIQTTGKLFVLWLQKKLETMCCKVIRIGKRVQPVTSKARQR